MTGSRSPGKARPGPMEAKDLVGYNGARQQDFRGARLSGAGLDGVAPTVTNWHEANLAGAVMLRAGLRRAYLRRVDPSGFVLSEANLPGVEVTEKQPAQAKSLQCATMPDSTVHE